MKYFGLPCRQETVCEKFPTEVIRIGVPYRQETVCEWFPIEMIHIPPWRRAKAPFHRKGVVPQALEDRGVSSFLIFRLIFKTLPSSFPWFHTDRKLLDRRFLDSASLRSK